MVKNPWKTVQCLNYHQAHTSGTREGFFSHGAICRKIQKQTKWWKCALIVMRQYYKHHGKTVLNLINKSLINCAGISSSNSQWYWVFIAQNRIHFKTRKTRVFPGFFSQLSETRVLKFCSELETLLLPCLDPFTNSEVTNNTNKTVAKVMHLRDIVTKEIKKDCNTFKWWKETT